MSFIQLARKPRIIKGRNESKIGLKEGIIKNLQEIQIRG